MYDKRGVSHVDEGDEEVCYLRAEEARELLHLPPHVFSLLCAHAEDGHADRNISTHIVQFMRKAQAHLIVNAHPMFRNSAFMMGNANEPFRGPHPRCQPRGAGARSSPLRTQERWIRPPSLQLEERTLLPLSDDDPLLLRLGLRQPDGARAMYGAFVHEFPEVRRTLSPHLPASLPASPASPCICCARVSPRCSG